MKTRYPIFLLIALPNYLLAQGGVPANDLCSTVTFVTTDSLVLIPFEGDNTGATGVGDFEEGSVPFSTGNASVWHGFHLDNCSDVTVAYCGSLEAFIGHYWHFLTTACPAADADLVWANTVDTTLCGDGLPTLFYYSLPAGDYLLPVLGNENLGLVGDYSISVSAVACATGVEELGQLHWSVLPGTDAASFSVQYDGRPTNGRVLVTDAVGRTLLDRVISMVPGGRYGFALPGTAVGIHTVRLEMGGAYGVQRLFLNPGL